jgi:hypothetical protein
VAAGPVSRIRRTALQIDNLFEISRREVSVMSTLAVMAGSASHRRHNLLSTAGTHVGPGIASASHLTEWANMLARDPGIRCLSREFPVLGTTSVFLAFSKSSRVKSTKGWPGTIRTTLMSPGPMNVTIQTSRNAERDAFISSITRSKSSSLPLWRASTKSR